MQVAGFEQGLIVGLAVVGDQDVELREILGQAAEQGGFLAVIAHEELAQAESGGLDTADSDQESIGAGASGEAGGFGIEEGPLGGMRGGDGAVGEGIKQVGRQFVEVRKYPCCHGGGGFRRVFRFQSVRRKRYGPLLRS